MSFTELKGMDNFNDKGMSEIVSENIVQFFDWGLMNKGAFYNVNIPTSGLYSVDKSILQCRNDQRFSTGKVWESANKNWVWQSGLSYDSIQISGVYVNGTFYPKNTTGAYSHYYDYNNGRVIFNSGIATSSVVKVEYSYKTVEISDIQNHPFFVYLQEQAYRNDKSHFGIRGSGEYNINPEMRMQIPSIAVETPPIDKIKPYSLGTGARYAYTDVRFHIFGDSLNICRRLSDVITDQKDKTIFLFDSNLIAESGAYPLDYKGSIKAGALTYPQLLEENKYRWRKATFVETEGSKNITQLSPTVYHTVVKCTVETVITTL